MGVAGVYVGVDQCKTGEGMVGIQGPLSVCLPISPEDPGTSGLGSLTSSQATPPTSWLLLSSPIPSHPPPSGGQWAGLSPVTPPPLIILWCYISLKDERNKSHQSWYILLLALRTNCCSWCSLLCICNTFYPYCILNYKLNINKPCIWIYIHWSFVIEFHKFRSVIYIYQFCTCHICI